jgi:hypothetical protein
MRSVGGYQTSHPGHFRLFSASSRLWVVGLLRLCRRVCLRICRRLWILTRILIRLMALPIPIQAPIQTLATNRRRRRPARCRDACLSGIPGIALHGMVANRLLATGNAFTDFSLQALLLDRCDASMVEGNLFSQGQGTAVVVGAGWRVTVRDNHIQDVALSGSAGAYAVELSNCRYGFVQGNRVTARDVRPRYAVHVDTYCDSVAVVDNDFRHGYSVGLVGDTGLRSYVVRNLPEPSFVEQVQDIVGAMVVDTATVKAVYDDPAGVLGLYVIPRTVDADMVDGLHADDLLDKATYDSDDDGVVEHSALADSVPWSGVTGAPATYPPDAHGHEWEEITGTPATYPPDAHGHEWEEITGTPATYPPDVHGHEWEEITGTPATYPPDTHGHPLDDLSDVQALAPVEGQILVFTAGAWRSVTAGSLELAELADDADLALVDDADAVLLGDVWVLEASAGSSLRRHVEVIGDGELLVFEISHGFGVREVVVTVLDATTYQQVIVDVVLTDLNTVSVAFDDPPASGAYRVVVIG